MGFDFVILCFTTAVLMKQSTRTDLWQMLFRDGLVYFLVSFTTNSIPAMFNILDLNIVMNIILTVPAAALSSIAACRVVIRLQDFKQPDLYVHSSANILHGKSRAGGASKSTRFTLTRPEIHVHTEHITMSNFSPSPATPPHGERNASRTSIDETTKDIGVNYEKESSTHYTHAV